MQMNIRGINDSGNHFKDIEERFRGQKQLTPLQWAVVRLDGHGFSTWVRQNYPMDNSSKDKWHPAFEKAMTDTALAMAKVYAPSLLYTFSDELTMVFEPSKVMQLSGGRILKLSTLMASMMTAKFAQASGKVSGDMATFDARAFSLPTHEDVAANISWRMCDARRNSVAQWARQYSSSKELSGMNSAQLIAHTEDGRHEGVIPWLSLPTHRRCGRLFKHVKVDVTMSEQELAAARENNPRFGCKGLEEHVDTLTDARIYTYQRSQYEPVADLLEEYCREPATTFWFSPQATHDRLTKLISQ